MDTSLLLECEPLIMAISNQFYGVDKEDLLQAGRVGLSCAYKNYKKDSNTKFSTFAYQWIYGEMYKLAVENNNIKQNRDTLKMVKLIEKTKTYLTQLMNKEPTLKDISNYLEIDESVLVNAYLSTQSILSLDKEYANDDLYNKTKYEEDNDMMIDIKNGINNLLTDNKK